MARASRASSSTPGRSGPSSAAPAASPTSSSRRTASSAARSPRTSPTPSAAGLAEHVGAKPGDCIFFAAGAAKPSRALLGAARLEIGRRCELIDEDAWSFLWVVDAPLFEPAADAVASGDVAVGAGAWTAVHHAFTSPKPEFLDTFDTDPGPALAYAYDIVCNGNEIGGGSIRIHRRDVQERVFTVMGLSEEDAQEKFGFLLEAFAFGAPPHGGIAFGWDRIVSLLAHTDSIRDVIAFPKSGGGYDPLTAAPAPITPAQRKEAGVDAKPAASAPAAAGRPRGQPEAELTSGTRRPWRVVVAAVTTTLHCVCRHLPRALPILDSGRPTVGAMRITTSPSRHRGASWARSSP